MWLSQFDQYHTLFNANLAQFINLRFFKLCQNNAKKREESLQKITDDHTSILNKTRYNVMLYTRQILHWVIVLMSNKCKFCLCIIHYGKCMTHYPILSKSIRIDFSSQRKKSKLLLVSELIIHSTELQYLCFTKYYN